jgi:hypothetical protein
MPQSVLLVLGRQVYREWSGRWMIGVQDVGSSTFSSSENLSHGFDEETASGGATNKRHSWTDVVFY